LNPSSNREPELSYTKPIPNLASAVAIFLSKYEHLYDSSESKPGHGLDSVLALGWCFVLYKRHHVDYKR
jgi:hypothetical protein